MMTPYTDADVASWCDWEGGVSKVRMLANLAEAKVDGPTYNAGRLEGWADISAQLRKILDPEDTHHWNLDGLLAEVARLRGGAS